MAKTKRHSKAKNDDDSDAPSPRQRNQGRGNGRGAPHGFGRGRGGSFNASLDQNEPGSGGGRGSPKGASTSKRPSYYPMQEIEFEVQQWPSSGSGYNSPRGRGSFSGRGSPSGRGSFDSSSRGNFRGRGRNGRGGSGKGAKSKLQEGAPLSKLLYETRPLLRPIKFVPSQFTATLFEKADDIFEPVVESSTSKAESHAPTANAVAHVFSGDAALEINDDIEEVDFADMSRIRDEVEKIAKDEPPQESNVVEVEENFTGLYIDTKSAQIEDSNSGGPDLDKPASKFLTPEIELSTEEPRYQKNPTSSTDHNVTEQSALDVEISPVESIDIVSDGQTKDTNQPNLLEEAQKVAEEAIIAMEAGESPEMFCVDTQPSLQESSQHVSFDPTDQSAPLGAPQDDEDDIIVYEAPNPRSGRATTGSQSVTLPKPPPTTVADISFADSPKTQDSRQIDSLRRGTLFERDGRKGKGKRKGKAVRRKRSAHPKFASFGAMMAESALHKEEEHDPRKHQRRKGDSDLEWGDESEGDADGNDALVAEGMDLDPDLIGEGVGLDAMKSFVDGVNGKTSQFVTMDDLEDIEKKAEMENSTNEGESESKESISDEEEKLIAGFEDSDRDEDEDSSETDGSPKSGFQAKLERMRKRQEKKLGLDVQEDEDDTHESLQQYVGEVEGFIDATNLRIQDRNRIVRAHVHQAIQEGDFNNPVTSSSKAKNIPPELREQWEKDRAKKAENKKKRELERLTAAVDPLAPHNGGKKSRKATLAAAKLDPSIEIPHRIVDIDSVEQQIRRFLADSTKDLMSLPPADKETRKKVHLLGQAFQLKTKSKSERDRRYVTLIKTKHTEYGVSEGKVARLMKEFRGRSSYQGLKTVEGQVVGHTAPKIDNSNIGFRMLASMGWADGDTIGLSGGLEAPITAVIKKTKLGLGAQR